MKLLLAENNPAEARPICELLAEAQSPSFEVLTVSRLENALEQIRTDSTIDALLLDLGLPDSDGLSTLLRVLGAAPALPIIVLTAHGDEGFAEQVLRAGAQDCVSKERFNTDSLGRVIRYAAERKRAEQKIRHLAAIVDSCNDAISSEAVYGNVLSWNQGAERVYGFTAAEMIGQPISRVLLPNRTTEHTYLIERLRAGDNVACVETVRRRKNGEEVNVLLTLSPMSDRAPQVVAVSTITTDLTTRKRTDAALQQSLADLRRFNQLAVGRELKIVELKQEVNALCDELKRPPRYPLQFLTAAALGEPGRQKSAPPVDVNAKSEPVQPHETE